MSPAAPKFTRFAGADATAARPALVALAVAVLAWSASGCARKAPAPQPAPPSQGAGVSPALPANWLTTERQIAPTDTLRDLEAKFEDSTDDHARQWALTAAGKMGEPAAVVWLARIAASNARVNRWAEDALTQVTNRHAALELGDVATSSGPPRVRAAAIRALASAGELPQAAQLSALVADPKQPLLVREASAVALGGMGRPGAVPALATALGSALADTKMTGQHLRVTIIQALGRIGTPQARQIIEEHAKRDLSPTERAVVEGSLAPRDRGPR